MIFNIFTLLFIWILTEKWMFVKPFKQRTLNTFFFHISYQSQLNKYIAVSGTLIKSVINGLYCVKPITTGSQCITWHLTDDLRITQC
jgi:hypothetical protein